VRAQGNEADTTPFTL